MASETAQTNLTDHRGSSLNTQMNDAQSPPKPAHHSPWLLPVLFAPVFMVILDVFIVNVTAPSLRADLGASDSDLQWVVAAYLLSYAISMITGGRLGDILGRRRMFKLGIAGFTVASALCAAAPSPSALIAARLLQGFGGAAMWPQVLSIIQVEFSPAERPKALGFQGLVQGTASIAGQIVGGGLIALDVLGLGWRSVFLINIPVGLVALLFADRLIPESRSESARKLDLVGVGLATLTLSLVMIPAVEGRELGWPAWTFVAFAAAIPAAAIFVAAERRIAARGGSPLAELGLFDTRGFRIGLASATSLYFVISFFFLLSIYLQEGLGLSPLDSGLAFTPIAVAFVAASLTGPRLADGVREYLPQIGAMLAAFGLITTIIAVQATGDRSVSAWLLLAMVPVGVGMGTAIPPLIHLVLRAVPPANAGAASGMMVTSQQIGNALGVALVGTVFFGELGSATSTGAFGDAFSVALAVQAVFALGAAALVSRARQTTEERARGGVPTREGATAR
jgi:EmrB/QacA subfamily drug resistance transporter